MTRRARRQQRQKASRELLTFTITAFLGLAFTFSLLVISERYMDNSATTIDTPVTITRPAPAP